MGKFSKQPALFFFKLITLILTEKNHQNVQKFARKLSIFGNQKHFWLQKTAPQPLLNSYLTPGAELELILVHDYSTNRIVYPITHIRLKKYYHEID